jgi:hypothetical protein
MRESSVSGARDPTHCVGVGDVVGGTQIHLPTSPPPPIFRGSPRPGCISMDPCGVRGGGDMGKVPSRGLATPPTVRGWVASWAGHKSTSPLLPRPHFFGDRPAPGVYQRTHAVCGAGETWGKCRLGGSRPRPLCGGGRRRGRATNPPPHFSPAPIFSGIAPPRV